MNDARFHAIIVEGPPHARQEAALRLAQEMVCRSEGTRPCGVCSQCRKVREGIHPDVIPVARFMEQKDRDDPAAAIKVDTVRALRADAFIRPNEAERKVYLLDGAERMNEAAQNVLLKVMEEGPAYAAFLLLTDRAGALLPTVCSRCVLHRANGPEEDAIPVDPLANELLAALARGDAMETAVFLARQDKLDRPAMDRMLRAGEETLAQAAVAAAGGRTPDAAGQALLARFSLPRLLELADIFRAARRDLAAQVSVGHILGALSAALV